MAISVDWDAKVISVPKADTQLVQAPPPQEIRQLDLNWFRQQLKALEASEEGHVFPDTHFHNPPVSVGGAVLARVLGIINGYTVTFEDGQYAVNLVGANSNVGDQTNVNQVSVRPQNSVGLQDLSSLQAASFGGLVHVDPVNGLSGTLFPIGTGASPVDNLADAKAIASDRGIREYRLLGDLVVTEPLVDSRVAGSGSHQAHMVDLNGQDVDATIFRNVSLTGALGAGVIQVEHSAVEAVSSFEGGLYNCRITSLGMAAGGTTSLFDCVDSVGGAGAAQLTAAPNSTLFVHGYSGDLQLNSWDATCLGAVNLAHGTLHLDASCTGGSLVIRGVGDIVRNDGGAVTLIDAAFLSDPSAKLRKKMVLARSASAPDLLVET